MKKIIIILLFICLIPVVSYAKSDKKNKTKQIFIIVNTDNDEILSLSNEDDVVMPDGNYKKYIINMNIADSLSAQVSLYVFEGLWWLSY